MTPTGETILAYSGGVIDRAANQRSDPGWIDATLAKAGTRLIPMWRDQCVVSGEPAVDRPVSAALLAGRSQLIVKRRRAPVDNA
jgi:NAD+ diphosphatase